MNQPQKEILILGIGNYLMGDEGIGVHLAQQLENELLPPGVDVLDGGTGGFHLLSYFEQYKTVIIVDATLDNNPAGTIRLIKPRFASDFPKAMSTHDIGLKDLTGALQLMDKMTSVYLFVVSIDSLQQQSIELSPEMAAVLPLLKQQLFELIERVQHRLTAVL